MRKGRPNQLSICRQALALNPCLVDVATLDILWKAKVWFKRSEQGTCGCSRDCGEYWGRYEMEQGCKATSSWRWRFLVSHLEWIYEPNINDRSNGSSLCRL